MAAVYKNLPGMIGDLEYLVSRAKACRPEQREKLSQALQYAASCLDHYLCVHEEDMLMLTREMLKRDDRFKASLVEAQKAFEA